MRDDTWALGGMGLAGADQNAFDVDLGHLLAISQCTMAPSRIEHR
jgi:hypothetical protein